jgi:hypothetical protein
MSLSSTIGLFFKLSFVGKIIRTVVGFLLGLAVLGWVVERCGPRDIEVVVHVMEPDVEVTIGDRPFKIEGRRHKPIVCELPPGWHRLIMRRGDRILFEDEFETRPGDWIVRTVWDPERLRKEEDAREAAASARRPPPRGVR